MSDQFVGEIRLVSFNYPPKGWAFCNGQLLPINQNQALFSLLGTTYGGNGTTTFALPDLRGKVGVHQGGGLSRGQAGGQAQVQLITSQLPQHTHTVSVSSQPTDSNDPGSSTVLGAAAMYVNAAPTGAMNAQTIGNAGGSAPHSNMQPSLVMSYCIALVDIYPSRS